MQPVKDLPAQRWGMKCMLEERDESRGAQEAGRLELASCWPVTTLHLHTPVALAAAPFPPETKPHISVASCPPHARPREVQETGWGTSGVWEKLTSGESCSNF